MFVDSCIALILFEKWVGKHTFEIQSFLKGVNFSELVFSRKFSLFTRFYYAAFDRRLGTKFRDSMTLTLENPAETIDRVRLAYDKISTDCDTIDGISMEFDVWRFNLRSPNTEPVVRLSVESKGNELLMQQ